MSRFELLRLWRSRRPLLFAGALVFFVALMLVGFYTYAQTETSGAAEFRYTFENASYFNGLTFGLYAFYFGFLLLLPICAATEGGVQIAGETTARTLGLLFARPIERERLFATKLVVAAVWTSLLTGAFLAFALLVGLFTVGWGDLDLYPGVLQMTDAHQHLDQGTALLRFALAWPAASLALLAPLGLAFLVSTCVKSSVNAVAVSVALYLVLYVTSEIHFFHELRPWLFTSSMSYWRDVFRETIPWGELARGASKLLGFAALFFALALTRFRRVEL